MKVSKKRPNALEDMVTAPNVDKDDFKLLKVIGRGSYGKVYMVEFRETGEIFAMKSIKKEVVIKAD